MGKRKKREKTKKKSKNEEKKKENGKKCLKMYANDAMTLAATIDSEMSWRAEKYNEQ